MVGDWGGEMPCGRSREQDLLPDGRAPRVSQRKGCLFPLVQVWATGRPTGSHWEDHRECGLLETSPEREPHSQPEVALPVTRENYCRCVHGRRGT